MNWTIRKSIIAVGLLGPLAAAGTGVCGLWGLDELRERNHALSQASLIIRNHMECDMMHDALRADVLSAMLASSEDAVREARVSAREDAENFREHLAANDKLVQDPALREAIAGVRPDVEAYIAQALSIIEARTPGGELPEAEFASFMERFGSLEESMGKLSDLIMARAQEVETSGAATAGQARSAVFWTLAGATIIAVGASILLGLRIVRRVDVIVNRIGEISQGKGNLATRIVNLSGGDEISTLAISFNTFSQRIHDIISEVADVTNGVKERAGGIHQSIEEADRGITNQSSSLQAIAAAIEELGGSATEVAGHAQSASDAAALSASQASEGQRTVARTIERLSQLEKVVENAGNRVAELGRRSQEINKVVTVIQDIADQTNLLALNAAIEAARAGEYGRGFAVVADEVRKLAERTAVATREVATSIGQVQQETTEANRTMSQGAAEMREVQTLADSARQSLAQSASSAENTTQMIRQIAESTQAQRSANDDIARRVVEIRDAGEAALKSSAATRDAAGTLTGNAQTLASLVNQFVLDRRSQSPRDLRVSPQGFTCDQGRVVNVSINGAQLEIRGSAGAVGSDIPLTFRHQGRAESVSARVVWSNPRWNHTVVGVRFGVPLKDLSYLFADRAAAA